MYKTAESEVKKGLSPMARLILGAVSALFGVGVILSPISEDKRFYSTAFGIFCLIICVACFTKGKVRQFVGSIIGLSLFVMSILYIYAQMSGGPLFSGQQSEPSVFNAISFFVAFGVPGLTYAIKVKFGWERNKK